MFKHPARIFTKSSQNPILTAADWPVPINSVFNSGACKAGDETVLLCRVEDTRGFSHLWVARSSDGITNWRVDAEPLLSGDENRIHQQWGFEDARIVQIENEPDWVVTCTAYGPPGPSVYMFTTDFKQITRQQTLLERNKNAAILPRKIDGNWLLLHRPTSSETKSGNLIEISKSKDMTSWGQPELVMNTRDGNWWDSVRIGIGPPPIETEHGWLLLYHGARTTVTGAIYRVGVALLDTNDPSIVTHRGDSWLLSPSEDYERIGDVNNVIFPCGMVHEPRSDELRLYYGAADTCMAVATAKLSDVIEYVRQCPAV